VKIETTSLHAAVMATLRVIQSVSDDPMPNARKRKRSRKLYYQVQTN
jgi:hypothetical protein